MQGLKGLVIFMGILIVIGLIVVAYGLASRMSGDRTGAFGEVDLALPAGCVIAGSEAENDRLILRIGGPAERGCQQVLVLDLKDGELLGRIMAQPAP